MTNPALEARLQRIEHNVDMLLSYDGRIGAAAVAVNIVHGAVIVFQKEARENFTEVKADMAGLKADVSGLKADVSGLKTDVADIKESVALILDRLPQPGR